VTSPLPSLRRGPFWQPDSEFSHAINRAETTAAKRILMWVIYQATWGQVESAQYRELSVSYLAAAANADKAWVSKALTDLRRNGVVRIIAESSGRRARTLGLEADWRKWGRYAPTELAVPVKPGVTRTLPDPDKATPFGCPPVTPQGDSQTPQMTRSDDRQTPKEEESRTSSIGGEGSDVNTDVTFDDFWSVYPRHEERALTMKEWSRLGDDERSSAASAAGNVAKVFCEGGKPLRFCKFPERFLREGTFRDWTRIPDAYVTTSSVDLAAAKQDPTCHFCGREIPAEERVEDSLTSFSEELRWYHNECFVAAPRGTGE